MIGRRLLLTLESSCLLRLRCVRKLCQGYTGDHSHALSFLGRNANEKQINRLLSAGAIEVDFEKYISTGELNQSCPIKRVFVNQLAANSPIEDRWNIGLTQVNGIVSSCLFTVLDGHSGTTCVHTLAWSMLDYVAAAFLDTDKLCMALSYWRTHDANQPYHLARRLDLVSSADGRRLGHAAQPPTSQLSSYMRRCLRDYVEELVGRTNRIMDPEHCLEDALQRIDADICSMEHTLNFNFNKSEQELLNSPQYALSRDLLRAALSGAVGIVGRLFWHNRPDKSGSLFPRIHLANVGDCGAVLLRERKDMTAGSNLEAIPCTVPHQGSSNLQEVERINSAHPENKPEELLRLGGRLLGELAPSRAFGDVRYKWPAERISQLSKILGQLNRSTHEMVRSVAPSSASDWFPLPQPYTSPPYLTAKPEVTSFEVTPEDRYLVLASDGLWDMLSHTDTIKTMQAELHRPTSPATRLLWTCLTQIPPETANTIAHPASPPSADKSDERAAYNRALKLLSLPPGLARYYRDDITVMVIEFVRQMSD